jgi:hypothetical protein
MRARWYIGAFNTSTPLKTMRGLAGPVRAHQADDVAGADVERHVVHGGQAAEAHGHVFKL